MSGKIVTGEVDPADLGVTMTHEHLSMTFECCFVPPKEKEMANTMFDLNNSGWIRQNPYSHKANLVLNDEVTQRAITESIATYKSMGGQALVENSTTGLNRNSSFIKDISLRTGVHVVAGTGFYVVASQDKDKLAWSTEQMSALMDSELIDGCADDPSVKCGLIGEIGCSWPLHAFERKVIEATAEVQQRHNCCVSFHPGRNPAAPFEIVRIFLEAGGKADKTIMSHLERTLQTEELLSEFSSFGTYCQFDLFGIEVSYYQLAQEIDYPSDAQRMDSIKFLIDEGLEDKVLVAQDIHTKHRLEAFGGHGFSHILENAIPKMTAQKGITDSQIKTILVDNPARVLQIHK